MLKLSTHCRRFSFSLEGLQTLSAHVYELALQSRPHTNLINRKLHFWIVLLLFSKSYQLLCTSKTKEMFRSSCPIKDNKPSSETGHSVSPPLRFEQKQSQQLRGWTTVNIQHGHGFSPQGELLSGAPRQKVTWSSDQREGKYPAVITWLWQEASSLVLCLNPAMSCVLLLHINQ